MPTHDLTQTRRRQVRWLVCRLLLAFCAGRRLAASLPLELLPAELATADVEVRASLLDLSRGIHIEPCQLLGSCAIDGHGVELLAPELAVLALERGHEIPRLTQVVREPRQRRFLWRRDAHARVRSAIGRLVRELAVADLRRTVQFCASARVEAQSLTGRLCREEMASDMFVSASKTTQPMRP